MIKNVDRLYVLYTQFIEDLRESVGCADEALGTPNPSMTKPEPLTRAEFETLMGNLANDPEAANAWLRRILRGHEHEFSELEVA